MIHTINLHIIEKISDEFKFLLDNKPPEDRNELQDDQKKDEQKKDKFKKTLKKLGKLNYIESPKHSKMWILAKEFSKTRGKLYKNRKGEGLSFADSLLLKYYLSYPNYELVTHDGPLKDAARKEAKKFRTELIFDPLS